MRLPNSRLLSALVVFLAGCSSEPEYVSKLTVSPTTVVVRQGQCQPVKLAWTPTAELSRREGNPTVFVHLLDGPHNLVRTFDHPLNFQWSVGKATSYEIDLCQSALAAPLGPGTYHLKVGLYDDAIGYRWPLLTNGVDAGKRGYRVAQVVVPSTPGAVPQFRFDGVWGAREQLDDKQVRARQQFKRRARLQVTGVKSAGIARLFIRLPEKTAAPTSITTSCGGRWTSSSPGHHVVELPIVDSRCEITFASGDPDGAYLEGLGWKAPWSAGGPPARAGH